MTKAYTMNDRLEPDLWVVWDTQSQEWEQARLIRNPDRPEPLLVGLNGKRYRIGDDTRCQTLESFFRDGDMTQIPHKWQVRKGDWAPQDGVTIDVEDDMDNGFVVRRGGWGR